MYNILSILTLFLLHPIHVSLMNLEYTGNNTYTLTIRVFSDDFSNNIKALYGTKIDMSNKNDINKNTNIIEAYFNKTIKIQFNKYKPKLKLISHRSNYQATWFNFKLSLQNKNTKKITIKNKVMNEYYHDQTNLLIFTKNNFQKNFMMNVNDTIVSFYIK